MSYACMMRTCSIDAVAMDWMASKGFFLSLVVATVYISNEHNVYNVLQVDLATNL